MSNETEWVLVPREKLEQVADGIFSRHHSAKENKDAYDVGYFGAMLKDVEEMLAAAPQPPAEAQPVKGAPIRYFAYDSDRGDYNEFDTLPEAIADAQEALDYAGDDGWPEGGPSIYYGAVLGEAREVEGSRRPAGPGDHPDADFIVEYELKGSDALAQQPAAVDGPLECDCGPEGSYSCPVCGSAFPSNSRQPAAVDEEEIRLAYHAWFRSEQGKPHEDFWGFGWAAWRAALAGQQGGDCHGE